MKDLKQEMIEAICQHITTGYENMPDGSRQEVEDINEYAAAETVTSIAERVAVEFAEWILRTAYDGYNEKSETHYWEVSGIMEFLDSSQLFKLFKENQNG